MKLALSVSAYLGLLTISAFAQTPQPYLLFQVGERVGYKSAVLGTLGSGIDFKFSGQSNDGLDSIEMRAKLIEKRSEGFRFSWSIVQRAQGLTVGTITTEELVPWGARRRLKSFPDYDVKVFYSPVTADQLSSK